MPAIAHDRRPAADRTVITLDDDAYDAFLQALEAPPQVNKKLLKALRRPSSITWID